MSDGSVELLALASARDAWDGLIKPWLSDQDANSTSLPSVVLAPSQAVISFLKSRILSDSSACFGIHFWTPGVIRDILLKEFSATARLARAEDLALIARVALSEAKGRSPQAEACYRDPTGLIQLHDQLTGSGRPLDVVSEAAVFQILRLYDSKLRDSGLWSRQQADQWLQCLEVSKPLFQSVLIWGFRSRDWEIKGLLDAAKKSSQKATMVFPPVSGRYDEMAWLGTWEQSYGPSEFITVKDATSRPAVLSNSVESLNLLEDTDKARVTLHLASEPEEEAHIIFHQVVKWLQLPECTRLGIVLPAGSLLARRVSALLHTNGLPHHDSMGHFAAQPCVYQLLEAWAEWQVKANINSWISWCGIAAEKGLLDLTILEDIKYLTNKHNNKLLSNQYNILEHSLNESEEIPESVKDWLNQWSLLPSKEVLNIYLQLVSDTVNFIGIETEIRKLEARIATLSAKLGDRVERKVFIEWLVNNLRKPGRSRYQNACNVFAKIQILDPLTAQEDDFSHLILGGLNQGIWPATRSPNPYLVETAKTQLNIESLKRGSQGDGHWVMEYGWLWRNQDQKDEETLAYYRLLESTDTLTISASRDLVEGEGTSGPSELWWRTAYVLGGEIPDERRMSQMLEQSKACLFGIKTVDEFPPMDSTLRAWKARNDGSNPFGCYDCGYKSPPPGGIRLSATAWEQNFKNPLKVWLENHLKIKAEERFLELPNPNIVVGQWVHQWLLANLNENFQPLPAGPYWRQQVEKASQQIRDKCQSCFDACSSPMPVWWLGYWQDALLKAQSFAEALSELRGWNECAAEISLPYDCVINFSEDGIFPVHGRMDLLLRRMHEGGYAYQVIDFKTGKPKSVSPEKLAEKGEGLQMALYILGLEKQAEEVNGNLLHAGDSITPGLTPESFRGKSGFWKDLIRMQRNAILGTGFIPRNDYGIEWVPPMATLSVHKSLVQKRWELTYPGLPGSAK